MYGSFPVINSTNNKPGKVVISATNQKIENTNFAGLLFFLLALITNYKK
ncbi:hypothetical protein RINTHH_10600 [Richelia intracellularis HH01]|mgnify:CR=1|jgi:hypothetical protein|uniref:Uncharacterized protein n=1 Tax=Richelia intracellularis HH01 TaxID=1165094 RepID=M1X2Q1_9NOST|nr:hypothetical protein RINTHH_10600 [Richelia intracellularis HH01]